MIRRLAIAAAVAALILIPTTKTYAQDNPWPCGGSCSTGEHLVQTLPSPYGGAYALTNWGGIWTTGNAPVYGLVSYLGYANTTPNPAAERAAHGVFAKGGLSVNPTGYTLTNVYGEQYGFSGPVIDNLKAARIAVSQIGLTGSYASGGFWCAQFVSWVEAQANTFGYEYQSSPDTLQGIAMSEGRFTTSPHLGDVAFIDLFGHNGIGDNGATHAGIVVGINGSQIVTVEGNEASNPNLVTIHTRSVGDGYLFGFGRW